MIQEQPDEKRNNDWFQASESAKLTTKFWCWMVQAIYVFRKAWVWQRSLVNIFLNKNVITTHSFLFCPHVWYLFCFVFFLLMSFAFVENCPVDRQKHGGDPLCKIKLLLTHQKYFTHFGITRFSCFHKYTDCFDNY